MGLAGLSWTRTITVRAKPSANSAPVWHSYVAPPGLLTVGRYSGGLRPRLNYAALPGLTRGGCAASYAPDPGPNPIAVRWVGAPTKWPSVAHVTSDLEGRPTRKLAPSTKVRRAPVRKRLPDSARLLTGAALRDNVSRTAGSSIARRAAAEPS